MSLNSNFYLTQVQLKREGTESNRGSFPGFNIVHPFLWLSICKNITSENFVTNLKGFNGKEKDDEVKGSGNHICFNDYGYDSRIGRRLNTDPKFAKARNESPYLVYAGNPIYYVDPDGNFKLSYTEEQLKENGLTKQDVERFENIINNIANLVKDNPQALSAISNTTGFDVNKILKDFKPGDGPVVEILPIGGGANGGINNIVFDVSMVKALASIDGADTKELSEQTLGVALTLLHEYGHKGDKTTNNGKNTGQYQTEKTEYKDGSHTKRKYRSDGDKTGKQKWHTTLTGHRGEDIEVVGFGVKVSVNSEGRTIIEKGSLSPTTRRENAPSVPSSLPENAKEGNILKTLEVK